MVDKGFWVDLEHLVVSQFVVECAGKVSLVRCLGDEGGDLCDVGSGDWAAVETGETEEEESLLGAEVAALDEHRHHLPGVILGTCGKNVFFVVFLDAVVEFFADVSHRSVEKVILWLGREVLSGN